MTGGGLRAYLQTNFRSVRESQSSDRGRKRGDDSMTWRKGNSIRNKYLNGEHTHHSMPSVPHCDCNNNLYVWIPGQKRNSHNDIIWFDEKINW